MRIDFLWIKEFGVIKDQGFNFNPNITYSYNKTLGELTRRSNFKVPENFFSDYGDSTILVNAIVGANGSGKSSAVEYLVGYLSSSNLTDGILVTEEYIYNKSADKIRIGKIWDGPRLDIVDRVTIANNNNPHIYRKLRPAYNYLLGQVITNATVLYYSGELNTNLMNRIGQSLFTLEDDFANGHFIDISEGAMMKKDQNKYRPDQPVYSGEHPIMAFRSGESQRFLNLMKSDFSKFIPFPLDNLRLKVQLTDIDSTFLDSYDEIAFKAISESIQAIIDSGKEKANEATIDFITEIVTEGIGGFFRKRYEEEQENKSNDLKLSIFPHLLLRHVRENILLTMGEYTNSQKFFHFLALLKDLAHYFFPKKRYINQIKSYLSSKISEANIAGNLKPKAINTFITTLNSFTHGQEGNFIFKLNDLDTIDRFFHALNEIDKKSGLKYKPSTIFEIDLRGLSTGEKQFLKLFSRIVELPLFDPTNQTKVKDLLFILDEFDIGFHPKWQRKYISILIDLIRNIATYSGKRINIQIILASHSPFVVSDLPKECITFLKRSEKDLYSVTDSLKNHVETFGANIHELFSDAFFLEGVLMGDFAESKINNLFKVLSEGLDISKHEAFLAEIKLVGEPLIRRKLLEMYAQRLGGSGELARLLEQQALINRRIDEILNSNNATDRENSRPGSQSNM